MSWTMTFKPGQTECFVYIALPGQTELVTAGRFRLETDNAGGAVGRFRYGRSYLARPDRVPLDPIELTLLPRTYTTARMKGVFGALRDAGPDYWGRRVIERHARTTALSEIDYLLYAPDDRAGALAFGLGQQPPAPRRDFNKTLQLERLQQIADAIISEEAIPQSASADQTDALLLAGTSMGGARPKAVIEHDDALWLAKFNHPEDRWNAARVEHAMLALARECGLSTASSQVIDVAGRDVLLVRRFDREKAEHGYTRAPVRGHGQQSRALVLSAACRGAATCLGGGEGGCAGAVPADVLQRHDLEHGRPSPQPCGHRQGDGLASLSRL
jgi:serine/threonine-protein kinase HipA